ncbi:MAG: hypothetical protein JXA33_11370 [Anaerolineae bacterium]|nr:hypothetical protein [Anaerolineae bacterium]
METKKQVIDNIVNLDIRTATAERVAGIERIGNVVNLFYTPDTAGLIPQLNIGNLVNSIEVPADAKMHYGQLVWTHKTFETLDALRLVVLGQLIIEKDVTPEDIAQKVAYLSVYGNVLCPEPLAGVLQAKLERYGSLHIYPVNVKPILGKLQLDTHFLRSLDDGTELMVIGKLDVTEEVPNALLSQKIKKIYVADGIICREENTDVLLPLLERTSGADRMTVIPAGFTMVERALTLTPVVLNALPSKKLYCTEIVQVDEAVTPQGLDAGLERLIAKETVLCPGALSEVMAKKLNVLDTDVIFYEDHLWLVKGEDTLSTTRFGLADGKVTLVVLGALNIAPDVDPKHLADTLHKVHNYGLICGTPDQIAVLQLRLGINEGQLTTTKPDEKEPATSESHELSNIVNLTL